jgi:hypothetical protein
MSAPADPVAFVRAAERHLAETLGLRPLPLPPALARAEAPWKGDRARLEATALAGGPVRWARFVTLVGDGLRVGNLVALGEPGRGLPILGADLVEVGGDRPALVVADLYPVTGTEAGADGPPAPPGVAPPPTRDGWAGLLSPAALFVRAGETDRPAAFAAAFRFVEAFAAAAPAEGGDANAERAAQRAYLAAHRADERTAAVLARIFGADHAARVLDEVMFPDLDVRDLRHA